MRPLIKTSLTLSLLFFISSFAFAQSTTAQLDSHSIVEKTNHNDQKQEAANARQELYWNHTQIATDQFSNHLSTAIKYTDQLENQYAEGYSIVEVILQKDGSIQSAQVIKNGHPQLDALVNNAVLQLKSINTNGLPYYGARRLRIPVNFSLR